MVHSYREGCLTLPALTYMMFYFTKLEDWMMFAPRFLKWASKWPKVTLFASLGE